jgi:hypothetical protein
VDLAVDSAGISRSDSSLAIAFMVMLIY